MLAELVDKESQWVSFQLHHFHHLDLKRIFTRKYCYNRENIPLSDVSMYAMHFHNVAKHAIINNKFMSRYVGQYAYKTKKLHKDE